MSDMVRLDLTVEGMKHHVVQQLVQFEGSIQEEIRQEVDRVLQDGRWQYELHLKVREETERQIRLAAERAINAAFRDNTIQASLDSIALKAVKAVVEETSRG